MQYPAFLTESLGTFLTSYFNHITIVTAFLLLYIYIYLHGCVYLESLYGLLPRSQHIASLLKFLRRYAGNNVHVHINKYLPFKYVVGVAHMSKAVGELYSLLSAQQDPRIPSRKEQVASI